MANPSLSSTLSSWTYTPAGDSKSFTYASASFSPPARSLITVAVSIGSYAATGQTPSISNTGTALTWQVAASHGVTTGLGGDNLYGGNVVVYQAWNTSAQSNITVTVAFSVSTGFVAGASGRGWVHVNADASSYAYPHSVTSSLLTTNDISPTGSIPDNSTILVTALEGTGAGTITSSNLTGTATDSIGPGSTIVGLRTITTGTGSTYNLDAAGAGAVEWMYAAGSAIPETAANVTAAPLASTLVVPAPTVTRAADPVSPTTIASTVRVLSPASVVAPLSITPKRIASTVTVGRPGVGAPTTNYDCEGTAGTYLNYANPGSPPAAFNPADSEWQPTPAGGFLGGQVWQQSGNDLFEYRSEVKHRGTTSLRPNPAFDTNESGGHWQVLSRIPQSSTQAHEAVSHWFQRSYFYLTEYPDNDMAFLWVENAFPFIGDAEVPHDWVGMCPWGRFELWTLGTSPTTGQGTSVRTDPNVIPLNQWFRVEMEVNANATKNRLTARLYLDAEAPVDGYDVELTSDWFETTRPTGWAGIPYSPYQGQVGDTPGAPYTGTASVYFDDVAYSPAAFGWIGPSGGAVSHWSTPAETVVNTPVVSLGQRLELPGVPSTATIGSPTVEEAVVRTRLYHQALLSLASGEINWANDTIKVMLVDEGYTPDADSHRYKSSVTDELLSSGYVAGGSTLSGRTSVFDSAADSVDLSASAVTFVGLTGSFRYAVVYKDTGLASSSPLICWIDAGSTQNLVSESVTVSFPADVVAVLEA